MEIRKEINGFYELADMVWSGAIDTLKDIERANLETNFMNYLEEVFFDDTPTDTQVNDFIWFERDMIYEAMGLNENGEVVDEEEQTEEQTKEMIEESIVNMSSAETFEDFCNDCDNCCLNCAAFPRVDDCEQAFEDFVNGKLAPDFIREEWGIL